MGKGVALSYSRVDRYKTCATNYDFYYNKKFRPRELSSPLWLGSALDDAFGRLLLTKKKELSDLEKSQMKYTAKEVFLKGIKDTNHNKSTVDIRTHEYSSFSKADYDSSLFLDEDYVSIGQDKEFCDAHVEWYHSEKKKKSPKIGKDDTSLFVKINWTSLMRKGLYIVEEYEKQVLPLVEEVFSIQEKVTLPNESGDSITGYIDVKLKFYDDPSVYIVDNKTSSSKYKENQLLESRQLHTYAEYAELNHIAYIVVQKNIRKRKEPRVVIDVMKAQIDEEVMNETFDEFENILHKIKDGIYPKTSDSNTCNFLYGKKCPYYDICYKETFPETLVNLNKK